LASSLDRKEVHCKSQGRIDGVRSWWAKMCSMRFERNLLGHRDPNTNIQEGNVKVKEFFLETVHSNSF
jgi:hypothetical protein